MTDKTCSVLIFLESDRIHILSIEGHKVCPAIKVCREETLANGIALLVELHHGTLQKCTDLIPLSILNDLEFPECP